MTIFRRVTTNPFTPASLGPALIEWWSGDAGISSGTNNTWAGYNGIVLTSSGTQRPTYTAGTTGPTGTGGGWSFNGTTNLMLSVANFPALFNPFDIYVGFMQTAGNTKGSQGTLVNQLNSNIVNYGSIIQLQNSNGFFAQGTGVEVTSTPNVYQYIELQVNGTNSFMGLNGVQSGSFTQSNTATNTSGLRVGANSSVPQNLFQGTIYEIAFFNRILSAGERNSLNTYFAAGPH